MPPRKTSAYPRRRNAVKAQKNNANNTPLLNLNNSSQSGLVSIGSADSSSNNSTHEAVLVSTINIASRKRKQSASHTVFMDVDSPLQSQSSSHAELAPELKKIECQFADTNNDFLNSYNVVLQVYRSGSCEASRLADHIETFKNLRDTDENYSVKFFGSEKFLSPNEMKATKKKEATLQLLQSSVELLDSTKILDLDTVGQDSCPLFIKVIPITKPIANPTILRFYNKELGTIILTRQVYIDKASVKAELAKVFGKVFEACNLFVIEDGKREECESYMDLTGRHLYLSPPKGEVEEFVSPPASLENLSEEYTYIDSTRTKSLSEGLPRISIPRRDLILKAVDHLAHDRILYIRSPPASGKTAFGQIVEQYFSYESREYECTLVTLLDGSENQTFLEFWKNVTGRTWQQFLDYAAQSKKQQLVIIDEAQDAFPNVKLSNVKVLWDYLKRLLQRRNDEDNIRFILLSTRGYNQSDVSPSSLSLESNLYWSVSDLFFSSEQMGRYCAFLFTCLGLDSSSDSSIALREHIKYCTGGFPGCLGHVSNQLQKKKRDRSTNCTAEYLLSCLGRNDFVHSLKDIRTSKCVSFIRNDKVYASAMENMLLDVARGQLVKADDIYRPEAVLLCQYGLLSLFKDDNSDGFYVSYAKASLLFGLLCSAYRTKPC